MRIIKTIMMKNKITTKKNLSGNELNIIQQLEDHHGINWRLLLTDRLNLVLMKAAASSLLILISDNGLSSPLVFFSAVIPDLELIYDLQTTLPSKADPVLRDSSVNQR